jgi:hypothetical protein
VWPFDNTPAKFPFWEVRLRAVAPGVAQVRLSGGGIERTIPIRVASVDEVVDATLTGAEWSSGHFIDVDEDSTVTPAPSTTKRRGRAYTLVLTLADGSQAVGGAGKLRTSGPITSWIGYTPTEKEEGLDAAQVEVWGSGPGTLSLALGRAERQWEIDL